MILATHALTGAVIGKNIDNPLFIIVVSLAVHYIMDSFRHGEYFDSRVATIQDTAWKVLSDLSFAGLILLVYLAFVEPDYLTFRNVILGSFFSMFPDLLSILYWEFKLSILYPPMRLHEIAHRYGRFPRFSPERQWTLRNALNDILISTLAIILLFL